MLLIVVPNDVELNNIGTKRCRINDRVMIYRWRLIVNIGTKRCRINNDRMELILVPNDVELNNDRME